MSGLVVLTPNTSVRYGGKKCGRYKKSDSTCTYLLNGLLRGRGKADVTGLFTNIGQTYWVAVLFIMITAPVPFTQIELPFY